MRWTLVFAAGAIIVAFIGGTAFGFLIVPQPQGPASNNSIVISPIAAVTYHNFIDNTSIAFDALHCRVQGANETQNKTVFTSSWVGVFAGANNSIVADALLYVPNPNGEESILIRCGSDYINPQAANYINKTGRGRQ